jgi:hypothetical protein
MSSFQTRDQCLHFGRSGGRCRHLGAEPHGQALAVEGNVGTGEGAGHQQQRQSRGNRQYGLGQPAQGSAFRQGLCRGRRGHNRGSQEHRRRGRFHVGEGLQAPEQLPGFPQFFGQFRRRGQPGFKLSFFFPLQFAVQVADELRGIGFILHTEWLLS